MNSSFLGMDPEASKTAMNKIKTKKVELDNEIKNSEITLNEKVQDAFSGDQTRAMQGFISRIKVAVEKFYQHLDGNESNFAKTFDEVIQSYVTSDENVSRSYDNINVE